MNIDQKTGYEIFRAFIAIDTDQREKVTTAQIDAYVATNLGFFSFGIRQTKYTQRIFHYVGHKEDLTEDEVLDGFAPGMNFREFLIRVWSYCSLSPSQLARQFFEIYDADNAGILERPDVESMYRMMYNCDEHEESCVKKFPYDEDGFVKKEFFINHCDWHRHLIQPAMGHQRKVRKKTGGVIMWAGLTSYRKKRFDGHDSSAETLADACLDIIEWVDPDRKLKLVDAEAVLAEEKRKLAEEAEKREQERVELERVRQEEEAKKQAAPKDDDVVRESLAAYEKALAEFEEDYFSTDDVWDRNEARQYLWSLLDGARETSQSYYARREEIEQVVTEGMREDHEARLAEYLETVEGQLLHRKNYILALLDILVAQEKEKAARRGRSALKQSKKEIQLSTAKFGAEEFDHRRKRRFKGQVLLEEEATAMKYAKKADIAEALKRAHESEYDWHKAKVIKEMLASQEVKRGWRVAEFNRVEHNLIEKHNARDSRWELVWDSRNKRTVYCNLDTLQTIRKHTAICERCDTIFVYHALTCAECGALRSVKNSKYYHKYLTRDPWEDADDDLHYSNKGHNWMPTVV